MLYAHAMRKHIILLQPNKVSNAHIKESSMASKNSASRRDHDHQQRKAETPEERKRRLDRLKEYRKWKRESEIQDDAGITTTTATTAQVGR